MKFIESDKVEFQPEVVKDICREVVAFANTNGGILYIGVEDDENVIGVAHSDRVTLQLRVLL